jgi:hypothetical protein
MSQTELFCFGCGILLIVVVGLVFYARAIEREKEYAFRASWLEGQIKDAIDKLNTNTSHYSTKEAWWEANR